MIQTVALIRNVKRGTPWRSTAAEHLAAYAPGDDGTLFVTRLRTPYRADLYGQLIKKAVRKAGLPDDVTSHALRHCYASVLIDAGESVVTVADRLGHTNPTTVPVTYAHLLRGTEDRTRRAIDQAFSSSPGLLPGLEDKA